MTVVALSRMTMMRPLCVVSVIVPMLVFMVMVVRMFMFMRMIVRC